MHSPRRRCRRPEPFPCASFSPIRRDRWTQTQVSPGPKWDIGDLTHALDYGDVRANGELPVQDEDEVRQIGEGVGANPSAQTPLIGQKNRNPPPTTTKVNRPRSIIFILQAYHDPLAAKKSPAEAGRSSGVTSRGTRTA